MTKNSFVAEVTFKQNMKIIKAFYREHILGWKSERGLVLNGLDILLKYSIKSNLLIQPPL